MCFDSDHSPNVTTRVWLHPFETNVPFNVFGRRGSNRLNTFAAKAQFLF